MLTSVKKRGNFASFFLAILLTILISAPAYSTEPEQSTEIPASVEQDAAQSAPETSAAGPETAPAASSSMAPSGGGPGGGSGISLPVPNTLLSTGAAAVSIPLVVPPGRNGIAPNLALTYNSNQGNGWLGVGWGMEMGSIQRATKRGVDYQATDFVFGINGSGTELVSKGSNYYGPKIEGDFSIFYYNAVTGGWEVTTKAGTKYFFGTTAAARQDNANGVFKWCLDRVQDTNGNYMEILYIKNNGEIYLNRINYTGNVNGLGATNYVQFYYDSNRPDVPPMYNDAYRQNIEAGVLSVTGFALGQWAPDAASAAYNVFRHQWGLFRTIKKSVYDTN